MEMATEIRAKRYADKEMETHVGEEVDQASPAVCHEHSICAVGTSHLMTQRSSGTNGLAGAPEYALQ